MECFTRLGEEIIYTAHRIVINRSRQRMEAEHLLIALIQQKEGILPLVFHKSKVKLKQCESNLEKYLDRTGRATSDSQDVYLSYHCEQIIRKAKQEADRMQDEYLNPEHLLLGIISIPSIEASKQLRIAGLEKKALVALIDKIRGGNRITKKSGKDDPNMITEFCQDLISLAKDNKFDPVIGRDEEVRRVIQVLSRRTKNNPVLIGETGVGKTAIIEGLAQRICNGDVPESLKKNRLLSLDLAGMIAGAKYRGEFEDRLKGLLKEIESSRENNILFIDELHTLIGAGASEGALDASNMLKPSLARGVLRCVGATTISEFKKHIEKDPALERRFQQVYIKEPTVDECIGILRGLKRKYEVYHGVRIKDAAIIAAVKLAHRYIPDRFLPDKAIDLVDEAASLIRIEIDSMPTVIDQKNRRILQLEIERRGLKKEDDAESLARIKELDKKITGLRAENDKLTRQWDVERKAIQRVRDIKKKIEIASQQELEAQRAGNLELAAKLKYGTLDDLQKALQKAHQTSEGSKGRLLKEEIDEEDIAVVASKWTGISVSKIMLVEQEKLLNMEKRMSAHLVGQNQALISVANVIRRARTGIQDPNRPLGSFIFMGPTGVGKTELAKTLALFLFDDPKAMVRLDMSEYIEKHAVSRLLGAPPGYTGFEEGGILTDAVRRKPYSVVLLDEIEKGHPEISHILLQVLDDGILTDSGGIKVDFKNTIVILTTNLASEAILKLHAENKKIGNSFTRKILLSKFRPELLNRVDEIVVFNPLKIDHIEQLVKIQVGQLIKRLRDTDTDLRISQDALKFLACNGFDPEFGARPLKRVIQQELEDVLAFKILDGTIQPGDHIEVRVQDQQLTFQRVKTEN